MIPIQSEQLLEVVGGTVEPDGAVSSRSATTQLQRVVTDSRCVVPGDLFVALAGTGRHGEEFLADAAAAGAVAAVVEHQGVGPAGLLCVRVAQSLSALWDLAAWNRDRSSAERIAVTGSFAKTTTRQMIHQVLSVRAASRQSPRNYNNEVGVPLSLLAVDSGDRFAVIEVGASGPGEIGPLSQLVRPAAAVLTGCGRAHLSGFGSVDALFEEKVRLLKAIQPGGLAVIPADCYRRIPRLAEGVQVVTIGVERGADIVATGIDHDSGMLRFVVSGQRFEVPVAGRHFVRSALSAVAVGRWRGISDRESAGALSSFCTDSGRCRVVHTARGTVIDDSYNASPESVLAACRLLDEWSCAGRRVLVLGDMAELGEHAAACHAEVGAEVGRCGRIDELWAAGTWADSTVEAAIEAGMAREDARACVSVEELLETLPKCLQAGDTLLIKGSRRSRMERVVQQVQQVEC